MNEGGAEQPVQQAPNPNPEIFTGNIMNFERPKFNARQENRLEALKCILVQDWLGPEGQKIYDGLDWSEDEDVNDYDLMWTKLERAVSPECNEIVAAKKFKERVQKPDETITAFITDLMLLVKDCNYTDEDRQVRDQFVYGIADDELKKRLLEKGNTLTRIDATTIGKAYENTKQEVQECCSKQPAKESIKAVSKEKPKKVLNMCNYCANKKGGIAFQIKNSALLGVQCSMPKMQNQKSFSRFKGM